MQRRGGGGGLGDALDRADEGDEIGFADDLQFAFRGAADRCLVERRQGGAAAGLAQRSGMQQVLPAAKSCTKAAPLTFAGRSTRGTLRPTTL